MIKVLVQFYFAAQLVPTHRTGTVIFCHTIAQKDNDNYQWLVYYPKYGLEELLLLCRPVRCLGL
jgi:hypothetical protein